MQETIDLFIVETEERGVRIDKLLAQRFPSFSRTYFQHLLEKGLVLLNEKIIKKRVIPETGDEIEVCFEALPSPELKPEPLPLDILFEDPHLLVINKPPGLVVHPAPGHWSGTFVNALLAHCESLPPSSHPLRPGIVHRLDKETSGVLIAAKTLLAQQNLIHLFAGRHVQKLYLALCKGRPPNGRINQPLGRHPYRRKEMAVLPQGREAITDIQVAATSDNISFVLVRPITGRTHQIRVHLKHLGCPILGDSIYGNHDLQERMFLHAYQLQLPHPITKEKLCFTAPIPEEFKKSLQKITGASLTSLT